MVRDLPHPSIIRQSEAYGPIGDVFALFTGLLAYWVVLLGATGIGPR